jgi:hypothetical protein
VTRNEHRRAWGRVVAALFAATALTLAGCGTAARHVADEAGPAAREVGEGVGKEAAKECAKECPGVAEDYIDSDGDGAVNKIDSDDSDPTVH